MSLPEAMRLLADHNGLLRFVSDDTDERMVRVILRLPSSPESRVIAVNVVGNADPLDVLVTTVQEAAAEVRVAEERQPLRLVRG